MDGNTHNTYWTGSSLIFYVDTTQVFNTCDRRIKKNAKPMRSILDRLCSIQMIEYNYKNTGIFKDDGCLHVGLYADELEDTFPEYKGSLVLGDREDVDDDNNVKAQSLTIKFEFILMKAIQELHDEIKVLKERINVLESK